MDPEVKSRILSKLQELGQGESSRLVLHLAHSREAEDEKLHPSQYSSRTEFRTALIKQKRDIGRDALAALTERLQGFKLKITPAHISQAVVVEGSIEDLDRAMSEPEVIDAIPDLPMRLPGADEGEEPQTD